MGTHYIDLTIVVPAARVTLDPRRSAAEDREFRGIVSRWVLIAPGPAQPATCMAAVFEGVILAGHFTIGFMCA